MATMNPIFDEINGLSPAAKQALQQAHTQATASIPTIGQGSQVPKITPEQKQQASLSAVAPAMDSSAPVPAMPIMKAPTSGIPSLPASSMAQVKAPRGTIEGDTAERGRLISTGSGISQIHNPLLRGLATAGSDIVQLAAPKIAAMIPGTEARHQALLHGVNNSLTGDINQAAHEAQIAQTKAGTERTEAETNRLNNPLDKFTPLPTDEGYAAFNATTGEAQPVKGPSGESIQPYNADKPIQHAVLPDGSVIAFSRGANGEISANEVFKGDAKSKPTITKLEINGKPHNVLVDENTGKTLKDLGETGEKPPTINVNSGEHAWEYANNQLTTIGKPIGDLSMRMGRLKDTLAQGSPQADALIAPELLTIMAGGQGSGLRMNEAEISRIVGGRSHWENLRAATQKWSLDPSSANSITADQRQQIRALVGAVDTNLQAKQGILNDAAIRLVDTSDSKEQHRILADTRQRLQSIDNHHEEASEQPKEGDEKTNSSGDKVIRRGGKWVPK